MQQLVECVPNFSEGRDPAVIEAIAEAIRTSADVKLLDVDSDGDYNRTVYTFAGTPDGVVAAALAAAKVAAKRIDMRGQTGGHPRLGAMDVVPFIPISGVSMDDCIACAQRFGKRLAEDVGIPAYLYEHAATRPERRNLADVRKGEYEGLAAKLQDADWAPDFGPAEFNAQSGATITGARPFLIAYNANLQTEDVTIAKEIAFAIRESGTLKRDANGAKIIGPDGKPERIPGSLKCVKGLGVPMPEHHIVQVSMNLTDFAVTPMHTAFEEIKRLAAKDGVEVSGSEIVGLVPLAAMLASGRFYAPDASDDDALIAAAIAGLGLSDLYAFEPDKKIIERKL